MGFTGDSRNITRVFFFNPFRHARGSSAQLAFEGGSVSLQSGSLEAGPGAHVRTPQLDVDVRDLRMLQP